MTTRFNEALRNLLADTVASAFDGGTLEIYSGAQPLSPADAATGTLLATIELPSPAFTPAVEGIAALAGLWSTNAIATGVAGWARFKNAGDTLRMDMAISDDELSLDVTDIVDTEQVSISAFTITQPES